ncbi:hypothetical protein EVA_17442 [gut metagenome]|uniref:Uncharacterized protein n=1 Tax=gut metagenome TaxID=749906 RepID=J9FHS4_9ZZZZ
MPFGGQQFRACVRFKAHSHNLKTPLSCRLQRSGQIVQDFPGKSRAFHRHDQQNSG